MVKPFGPRMQSEIDGFTVVGDLKWRAWGGIVADLWTVRCSDDAHGTYVSPDPRLFIPFALEGTGSFLLRGDHPSPSVACRASSISYVPAGYPLHATARALAGLRHLDIHFNSLSLQRRLGRSLRIDDLEEPRLGLEDGRGAALAGLIAEAIEGDAHELYLDGLTNALLCLVFDIGPDTRKRRSALSRSQLRLALDHIERHCLETIRLADMANVAGLSESQFSHAFKSATGISPHRWVAQLRVRRAQNLLLTSGETLGAIAVQCGFSDQAHFNRVFRSVMGTTPGAWRRANSRAVL